MDRLQHAGGALLGVGVEVEVTSMGAQMENCAMSLSYDIMVWLSAVAKLAARRQLRLRWVLIDLG
jgi:hypothetical protein